MIASSFRGAQLVEPIVRDIPQPQPVSTVYVDPAYRVRPYLTCAKGYTQFWGTLGTWKYQPIDDSLFSKKVKSISPEESNRLPCLPVDSLDHDDGAGVFDFVEALIDCLSFCWFGAPTEKPRPQLTEEELEWSPFAWAPLTDGEIERGVVADWSARPVREAGAEVWSWYEVLSKSVRYRRSNEVSSALPRSVLHWHDALSKSFSPYRQEVFRVFPQTERLEALEEKGILAPEVLDEYYKPCVTQWKKNDLITIDDNEWRWALLDHTVNDTFKVRETQCKFVDNKPTEKVLWTEVRTTKRKSDRQQISKFDVSQRFQRYASHGKFSGAATSSLVARSIRYFGPEEIEPTYNSMWERRIDPSVDFHDLMDAQYRVYKTKTTTEPDDVIKANIAAIEAEIRAGDERKHKLCEEYDAAQKLREEKEAKELREKLKIVAKPGAKVADCRLWEKPVYVSPQPTWVKFHGDISKIEYHKPNYGVFMRDGYTGNKPEKELTDKEKFPFIRAARPSKEEQREWDKKLGITAEIRGIKRQRADDVEGFDEDSEEFESHNSFFDDDEESAGPPEGHDHIIDKTRQTHKPRTHEELKATRKLADDKIRHGNFDSKIPIIMTMLHGNRTPAEALVKHNAVDEVKPKTLQKQKERFMKEAKMSADRPNGIPYVPFSDEMFDVIKDGGAYALMNLGNGWRYHRLPTKGCRFLTQAVAKLKEAKILSAWRESDLRKRTQKDFIRNKKKRLQERQKIVARIDRCFSKIHVIADPLQWPNGCTWRGILSEVIKENADLSLAA